MLGHGRQWRRRDGGALWRVFLMRPAKSAAVERMEQVLAGKDMAVAELMDLVGLLKRERRFGLARKGLARYASLPAVRTSPPLPLKVAQQRSLCTYQDPGLPAAHRPEH